MWVVLAWLLAGVTVVLALLLVFVGRDRARLSKIERRSRLGAEHARLHLSVLARAGDELSGAFESYDDALQRLGGVVVPVFADWFSVDLVDESGDVQRVGTAERGTVVSGGSRHRHPDGDAMVRHVVDSGKDQVLANAPLGTHGDRPHVGALVVPGTRAQAEAAPGVESMMIVPVHVRGLVLGALSFVTAPGRRGYRLSDLETAHGLAERVAVAIERVLLWRDSRDAEQAAIARAEQLRRLMEAALAVNAPLAEPDILDVLANHARRVLGAQRAFVFTVAGHEPDPGRDEVIAAVCSPRIDPEELGDVTTAVCNLVLLQDRPLRSAGATRPQGEIAAEPGDAPGVFVEGLPQGVEVDDMLIPTTGDPWIAVPVPGPGGGSRRAIVVEGLSTGESPAPASVPPSFGSEDESVLVLLAQIASVALVNADLYQEVRTSERRLRAVVESSPLAIAELAPDGVVRWWNRAAESLLGAPKPERAASERWRIPVDPGSLAHWTKLLDRSAGGNAQVGMAIRTTGQSGDMRELSVSSAPLFDNEGLVSGVLVVAEDVTERNRVLEQMHQSEQLAAMARLAGGVAHDFNNLLTVIVGSSDLLSRSQEIDQSTRQEVEAIQRAAQRASALTSQLLAIGRNRVEPVALDVNEELSSFVPMLERILGERVSLGLVLSEESPRILADPAGLERAVLNLAINARDAMPEGGTFSLTTRVVGTDERASAQDRPRLVFVAASDTGEGMDDETARHCFEPFFSTKARGQGTGLGLFAVDALVTQAGGHIAVDSAPGRGTTFTLQFPELEPVSAEHSGRQQKP